MPGRIRSTNPRSLNVRLRSLRNTPHPSKVQENCSGPPKRANQIYAGEMLESCLECSEIQHLTVMSVGVHQRYYQTTASVSRFPEHVQDFRSILTFLIILAKVLGKLKNRKLYCRISIIKNSLFLRVRCVRDSFVCLSRGLLPTSQRARDEGPSVNTSTIDENRQPGQLKHL